MLKVTLLSLLLLVSLVELSLQDGYRKIIHNTDPEARCLDGSPAMIYVHEGGLKDRSHYAFLPGRRHLWRSDNGKDSIELL